MALFDSALAVVFLLPVALEGRRNGGKPVQFERDPLIVTIYFVCLLVAAKMIRLSELSMPFMPAEKYHKPYCHLRTPY